MNTHYRAYLFMFPLLTYLLFRRPGSSASRRYPTELNFQISHSAHLNSEAPGKIFAQSSGWNGVSRSFLRRVSPGLALIPLLSVFAMAQTPARKPSWLPLTMFPGPAREIKKVKRVFSGGTQALKKTTFTADYKLAEGFLMRDEWRRNFSNQPCFPT